MAGRRERLTELSIPRVKARNLPLARGYSADGAGQWVMQLGVRVAHRALETVPRISEARTRRPVPDDLHCLRCRLRRCPPQPDALSRMSGRARMDAEAMIRSDGGAEGVGRSLKTLADFGQFSCGEVDAFLLYLRSVLLVLSSPLLNLSALAKIPELFLHLRDRSRQVGQLSSDCRYVLVGRHVGRIMYWNTRRASGAIGFPVCTRPLRGTGR